MNRPVFIERLLSYYAERGFRGQIWIGDSSSGQLLERSREVASRYSASVNIQYREFPGASNHVGVKRMAEASPTDYGAYLADDDFLTFEGLLESLAFLERRPDFSAVHGWGTILLMPSADPYAEPIDANYYAQSTWLQDRAADRLESYMRTGTQPLFALHRMSVVRKMYEHVDEVSEFNIAGELLPGALSAISGKIGAIDCLTLVRTTHPEGSAIRYLPVVDRILSPEWQTSVLTTVDLLVAALSEKDGISLDGASKIVKGAMHEYLARQVIRGKVAPVTQARTWRRRLGVVPGLRLIRRRVQAFKGGGQYRMTLDALSRGNSRDSEYFAPVLRSFRKSLPDSSGN